MFENVSTPQLRALLDGLKEGSIAAPLTTPRLLASGFTSLAKHQAQLAHFTTESLCLLCEAILAERHKQQQSAELVWTGPEGRAATARSTFVVFRDLLAGAQRSVWMAGYRVDHGKDLFAPLHQAMLQRGVKVTFLLNFDAEVSRQDAVHDKAVELINGFRTDNWPFEGPRPRFFYDPRSLQPRARASMHAKALVVDETHTLIGSANFTNRGQHRNIEAGALIHDEGFAKSLVTQFQSLIDSGYVHAYEADG